MAQGETKNLGQIAALWISINAPQDHELIWYDTTERVHKVYETATDTWRALNPQVVTNSDIQTLTVIANNSGLSVGKFYYLQDVGTLAIAITLTKIWYVDSNDNYVVNDLAASIQYHINSTNLLIDGSRGVWNTETGKLEFVFDKYENADSIDPASDYIVIRRKNQDSVWSWVKTKLGAFVSSVSGNNISWNKGFYFNFNTALNSMINVSGGVVGYGLYNNDKIAFNNSIGEVTELVNQNYSTITNLINNLRTSLQESIDELDDILHTQITLSGSITARSFIKTGGTSNQFLKADGSVDSRAYITSAALVGYVTESMLAGYATKQELTDYVTNNSLRDTLEGYLPLSGGTLEASNQGYYLDLYGDGITLGHSNGVASFNLTTDADNTGRILRLTAGGFEIKCDVEITGSATANSFVKTGGTSNQFLKADGSVDSNTYAISSSLEGYLPITGGTIDGDVIINESLVVTEPVTAEKFIIPSGTSNQFLKADGSVDSTVYLTTSMLTGILASYVTNDALTIRLNDYVLNSTLVEGYVSKILFDSTITNYVTKELLNTTLSGYASLSGATFTGDISVRNVGATGTITAAEGIISRGSLIGKSLSCDGNAAITGNVIMQGNSSINRISDCTSASINTLSVNTINIGSTSAYIRVKSSVYDSTVFIGNQLQVNQDISAQYVIATQDMTANNFIQRSDMRKKNIMREISLHSEEIAKAPSVIFKWKGDNNDKRNHAGTIAQYWQSLLPEVVTINIDDTLFMDYASAAMVSVISLAKEVVILKREIEDLNSRLN